MVPPVEGAPVTVIKVRGEMEGEEAVSTTEVCHREVQALRSSDFVRKLHDGVIIARDLRAGEGVYYVEACC